LQSLSYSLRRIDPHPDVSLTEAILQKSFYRVRHGGLCTMVSVASAGWTFPKISGNTKSLSAISRAVNKLSK
jgi:hypothetical protein